MLYLKAGDKDTGIFGFVKNKFQTLTKIMIANWGGIIINVY